MADNETIADIVRKMRNEIAELRKVSPNVPSIAADWWEARADEIEAAHKREAGDAAKLREALMRIRDGIIGESKLSSAQIVNIADAALAAPERNCDRYRTADDARAAWIGLNIGIIKRYSDFEDWLFAKAEGGTDGK